MAKQHCKQLKQVLNSEKNGQSQITITLRSACASCARVNGFRSN